MVEGAGDGLAFSRGDCGRFDGDRLGGFCFSGRGSRHCGRQAAQAAERRGRW